MSEADKAEWIAERAALIFEGCGGDNGGSYAVAEMLAGRCWKRTYGDAQEGLFTS